MPHNISSNVGGENPDFASVIAAFSSSSLPVSSQTADFVTLMSKRSPDPDQLAHIVAMKQNSFNDPFLVQLAFVAVEKLRMVQHVRMMHVCLASYLIQAFFFFFFLFCHIYRHSARQVYAT